MKRTNDEFKLLIVDDHDVVRRGIKSLIENQTGINIVGEASSAEEALDLIPELAPDLVISDLSMTGMTGIDLTIKIKESYPNVFVLILSMHNDEEYILDALNAGAMGYLTKDVPKEEFLAALESLSEGKMHYSSSLTDILARQLLKKSKKEEETDAKGITERELEIINLIVKGYSNKEIADKLYVSKRTVDNHRFNLMKKLGAHNTADIVRISFLKNLVDLK